MDDEVHRMPTSLDPSLERCESCNVPLGVGACRRCHEARCGIAKQVIARARTAEQQVKHMVERFLQWKLPANFNPDCGISFAPEFNVEWNAKQGKPPQRHEPVGTNLFSADQAEAMVRYMLEGAPAVERLSRPSNPDAVKLVEDLEMARELIQEAKGAEGPNDDFITNHLDAAEHWIGKVQDALSRQPYPAPDVERAWKAGFCRGDNRHYPLPPTSEEIDAAWRASKTFKGLTALTGSTE